MSPQQVVQPLAAGGRRHRDPSYSQSLERGLAVLGCFTAQRPVRGIADIASELGMSRSTTHRYVSTLSTLGYLQQERSRKYRLGLRVTDLGLAAINAMPLGEQAHPHVEQLRREASLTVSLSVLDGTEILYLDRAPSLKAGVRLAELPLAAGSRAPAYCTAMGKVLLAQLPEDERELRLRQLKLAKRGPNTITTKQALRLELEQALAEGYAVNDEELAAGEHAIGAPVRGPREVVAAIAVTAPTSAISLSELLDAYTPHLLTAADRIAAQLGYRRPERLAS
jgi:IclR family pca regulon transcriptional regulator